MTRRQQTEGCNQIQCAEISSSSDVSILNFNYRNYTILPRGRQTYRRIIFANPYNLPPVEYPVAAMPDVVPVNPDNPVQIPCMACDGPYNLNFSQHTLNTLSTRTALIYVALIFLGSLLLLSLVYGSFPELSESEKTHMRLPWNIEQAKQLGIVLNRYKDDNYLQVLGGVFLTYIFLQTFAIPGSLFLSILSGFLFPFFAALFLVCTCSAIGASLCFLLSQLLGRKLVLKYFPERANKWAVIVNKQKDNLFNYVVFLRITPFLPNWFINLTAPVIGVPLKPFALGTFIGVAPPSFVAIQAGQTLHEMTAADSAFSWTSISLLGVFAVVSLIPIFLKQRLKEKFD